MSVRITITVPRASLDDAGRVIRALGYAPGQMRTLRDEGRTRIVWPALHLSDPHQSGQLTIESDE